MAKMAELAQDIGPFLEKAHRRGYLQGVKDSGVSRGEAAALHEIRFDERADEQDLQDVYARWTPDE